MAMSFPDGPGTLQKEQHMAQFPHSTLTILRRKQVQIETGYSRSTIVEEVSEEILIEEGMH